MSVPAIPSAPETGPCRSIRNAVNSVSEHQSTVNGVIRTDANGVLQQFARWWRSQSIEERYLAGATDLADLERRMRVLERGSNGPVFVTFNH